MYRMTASKTSGLADTLVRGRNTDGAWGYYPGKASRIEPTCWIALYLSRAGKSANHTADGLSRWFVSRQRADGFLDDGTGGSPNLAFNGLAALAVRSGGSWSREHSRRLVDAVARTKGVALEGGPNRQDNTLQGWCWTEGTFSWIEPTSWCLLALKKSPGLLPEPERCARINEAERMLLDRVCQSGGWNYGNSNMLGQELRPHVPTTALALLALQDHRDHPSVRKSIEYLIHQRLSEPAGMALSLTSICLRVYGMSAPDVDERLASLAGHHRFFNNQHVAAMTLYSLTGPDHDVEDFRL
jgi:hypothetical protein